MRGAELQLTDREVAAYDALYPDIRFKAGTRTFPDLAMVEPEMERVVEAQAALRFWADDWSGQAFKLSARRTRTKVRCRPSKQRSTAAPSR